jgi:hypothetical protein
MEQPVSCREQVAGIWSRKLPREGCRGEQEKIREQERPVSRKKRRERQLMSEEIWRKEEGDGFRLRGYLGD